MTALLTPCAPSCGATGRDVRAARAAADGVGSAGQCVLDGRVSRSTAVAMPVARAVAWLDVVRGEDSCGPLSAPEKTLRRGAERGPHSPGEGLPPRSTGVKRPAPQVAPRLSFRHGGAGEEGEGGGHR